MSRLDLENPKTSRQEFTKSQTSEFREAFDLFDRDSDGSISFKEFSTIMRAFGQHYAELDLSDMFTEVDEADSGVINFAQFLSIMEIYYQEDTSEEGLIQAFRAFDKEGVGYINKNDLKEIMLNYGDKMSEDEFTEFVTAADINKDGVIKYDLFASMVAAVLAE